MKNRWAWFVCFLAITAGWQAVYSMTMTRGELSGLFFQGDRFHRPPGMASEGYVYANSAGYDGEFYRLLARDPLGRKGYWRYMDDPRYRARRILIPALSFVLGAGEPAAVDFSYVLIVDVFLALGGVCFLRLAKGCCPSWLAAALYLFIPAVVASTDRMLTDGPVVAGFLAAWVFLEERRTVPLLAVLTLLPLARETALCVTAGVVAVYAVERRFRMASLAAASTAPAVAWWCFVALRTHPSGAPGALIRLPLWPQFLRLFQPYSRPVAQPIDLFLQALDEVACLCLLLAFAWLAVRLVSDLRRGRVAEDVWLVLPSAALAAVAGSRQIMSEGYAFMRADSVLIAWAAVRMLWISPLRMAWYLPASSLALTVYRAGPFLRLLGH